MVRDMTAGSPASKSRALSVIIEVSAVKTDDFISVIRLAP